MISKIDNRHFILYKIIDENKKKNDELYFFSSLEESHFLRSGEVIKEYCIKTRRSNILA